MVNHLFWTGSMLAISLMGSSAVAAERVYAQLSTMVDQVATSLSLNQGMPIQLQQTVAINGMLWDADSNSIVIKEEGTYAILATMQVGVQEQSNTVFKGGDVYYWVNLNQHPITHSGRWAYASSQARSKHLSAVWISALKAEDNLQFMYSSSALSLGFIGKTAAEPFLVAPAVAISVIKLDES